LAIFDGWERVDQVSGFCIQEVHDGFLKRARRVAWVDE
jgi:hypothetical protein